MFKKLFWFILLFYFLLPFIFSLFGYDLKEVTEKFGFWMDKIVSPLFWMSKIPGLKSKGIFINVIVFLLIWWRIRFWKRKIKGKKKNSSPK